MLNIRYYTLVDFLRFDAQGKIDWEKAFTIIQSISEAVAIEPDQHVLVDLRQTTTTLPRHPHVGKIHELIVEKLGSFEGKLAVIIPPDPERVTMEQALKEKLVARGFRFNFFHTFEDAMEWLADIKPY